MMPALMALFAMVAVASAVFFGGQLILERVIIARRLNNINNNKVDRNKAIQTRPIGLLVTIKDLINSGLSYLSRFSSTSTRDSVRKKLLLAGNPHGIQANEFIGIRLAMVVISVTLVYLITNSSRLLFTAAAGISVWLFFDMYLQRIIAERQKQIVKSLPDVLDILTVCVEAGLGFDAAITRIVEKFKGPIADEFTRLLQDMRVGRTRREALRDFGTRSGVEDLNTFATAIVQADQLGVSIANILRVQSERLRVKRKQTAEEKALKAPVKMVIPMILLIFPAVFVILLGPGIIQIVGVLTNE